MREAIENWATQIRAGDVRAMSRALTAIENGEARAQLLIRQLFRFTGHAWKIGVTGAAGTGKSTLVNCLAAHFRAQGRTVGIVAVDPSSPFTGGAILGDRIRMQDLAIDEGVFIRSMGSRGAWGGLARPTADAALVLDAAGKEIVLIETVGVGQDEVDVAGVADCTLVVVTPGSGDEVQSLKAGLLEIADIFVLNKADYAEADAFAQQFADSVQLAPAANGRTPKIMRTVATEKKGIVELVQSIEEFRASREVGGDRAAAEAAHWKEWLLRAVQDRIADNLLQAEATGLERAARAIACREQDPYTAADELLAKIGAAPADVRNSASRGNH